MNLPERKTTSLELYGKNTGVIKAVNLRREMIKLPEVMNSLSVIDQGIFIATTTTRISDYSDNNLVQALNVLTKFIGKDLGIKGEIEPYEQTRFLEILKKYYSDLTVQEVKISFELSLTGELDEFLPKDSTGSPDKKHYQQFSLEYITKILNAYKKRKQGTVSKAFAALPEYKEEISEERKNYYYNTMINDLLYSFFKFKYLNIFDVNSISGKLYYEVLEFVGLAEAIEINEHDKKVAVNEFRKRGQNGLIDEFLLASIKKIGTEHPSITPEAYFAAEIRTIKETYIMIIREEIQILNYIKYRK